MEREDVVCTSCHLSKQSMNFFKSMVSGKVPALCHPCRKAAIKKQRKEKRVSNAKLPRTMSRREGLVKRATPSELKLKAALELLCEGRGVLWEFQKPIGPFFADFAVHRLRIVIEIDGGYHNTDYQKAYDQRRTAFLEKEGWSVVRFTNDHVDRELIGVTNEIFRMMGLRTNLRESVAA
jgi:very-short-patch-repair endonuclease